MSYDKMTFVLPKLFEVSSHLLTYMYIGCTSLLLSSDSDRQTASTFCELTSTELICLCPHENCEVQAIKGLRVSKDHYQNLLRKPSPVNPGRLWWFESDVDSKSHTCSPTSRAGRLSMGDHTPACNHQPSPVFRNSA
jgi:hypothetical protein